MSKFLPILLFLINIISVSGLDLPAARISDDSSLRIRLKDTWFLDTPRKVLSLSKRIELLPTGERVEVSATEGREDFIVMLSRELMGGKIAADGNPASPRLPAGQFPGWAQGSWILSRNKTTGEANLIRIFLRSDQNTFIQFRPFTIDKCLMDAVVYGAYVTRSLPIALPPPSVPGLTQTSHTALERLYTMPLNEILKLAEGKFTAKYFEPDPSLYTDSRTFIAQVRERLGGLRYADDGAIDENGSYVFIHNLQSQNPAAAGLNCSGFLKWMIDGMIRPVTGANLSITPLKQPLGNRGSSFTVNWEERRDVFFGLDWIRNLAAEANSILRSPAYRSLDEIEIRRDNFSLLIVNENRTLIDRSYPGFLNEAGYGIEGLRPLLYTLAIDEPYSFYLAAVNTEISTPSSPRGTPRLRQYFHTAAFIPYFDEYGVFRIVVFESAAETSYSAFRSRYDLNHFVNLVKVPVPKIFEPQKTN